MFDLVQLCIENDPLQPDFATDLYNEEKIKERKLRYMTDKERSLVETTRLEFYQRHAMRKIIEIFPFKKP